MIVFFSDSCFFINKIQRRNKKYIEYNDTVTVIKIVSLNGTIAVGFEKKSALSKQAKC